MQLDFRKIEKEYSTEIAEDIKREISGEIKKEIIEHVEKEGFYQIPIESDKVAIGNMDNISEVLSIMFKRVNEETIEVDFYKFQFSND